MLGSLELQPVTTADQDLLFRIYAGTRSEEMALVPWSDQEKSEFLVMQFTAQKTDYESRFPASEHSIISLHGEPVGRIWIDRRPDEIRLLDIAILPEHRDRGIGKALIERMQFEAVSEKTALRHSVSSSNQAATRLYERLGFTVIEDFETYVLMEWQQPTS